MVNPEIDKLYVRGLLLNISSYVFGSVTSIIIFGFWSFEVQKWVILKSSLGFLHLDGTESLPSYIIGSHHKVLVIPARLAGLTIIWSLTEESNAIIIHYYPLITYANGLIR